MANINYEKNIIIDQTKSQVDILVKVSPVEYAKVFEIAAEKYALKVSMPGFRKGKVPVSAVKASYSSEISEQAFNTMIDMIVKDLLSQAKERPISSMRINMEEASQSEEEANNFKFTLSYAFRIAPKLTDISNLKISRDSVDVTEDEIKESMDMLLQNVNSKKALNTSSTNNTLEANVTTNDTKVDDQTTSQDEGWDEDKIKLLKIENVNNLEQLTELVKKELENQKKYENEIAYRAKILDEIIKSSSIVIPAIIMEDMLVKQEEDFKNRIQKLGFEYDTYLKEKNIDLVSLRKEWEELVKADLSRELVLSQYAVDENLMPSEQELDNAVMSADPELKERYDTESLRQYMSYVLLNNIAFSKIYAQVAEV